MPKRNRLGADGVARPELPRLCTSVNTAPFSGIMMVTVANHLPLVRRADANRLDIVLPELVPTAPPGSQSRHSGVSASAPDIS
jgi:hypothetical protein